MSLLLPLGPLLPFAMLLALLHPRARGMVLRGLWAAPLPALGVALLAWDAPALVFDADGLRLNLVLGAPAALLSGAAALLWSLAGWHAQATMGGSARFAAWWLLTLTGSLGVFVAGDLLTFYFAFAVASLAGFGLVVQDGSARARAAGGLYLLIAVLGEIALLLAFALLAVGAPGDSLAIADVVPPLENSPGNGVVALLLVLGFGMKMGLVPVHVWLPVAHPAAPTPASAVLSGAITKAGVIGLVQFLPETGAPTGWGLGLALLGFLTAYWGVVAGLTQRAPKTILAYSSVSQMGVVAAVVGMGIHGAVEGSSLHVAFYAAHHALAKGALFLAVGAAMAGGARARLAVLALALLLALAFGGLPPTGGALAKAAVKPELGEGLAATAAALSALGSTMLMLHFVHRLHLAMREAAEAKPAPLLPWLLLGLAALLLPWLWIGAVPGEAAGKIWSPEAWGPVALGAVLALAWARWGARVPALPEGDILVLLRRGAGPQAAAARALAGVERRLRPWPAAGLALIAVIFALILAMAFARG